MGDDRKSSRKGRDDDSPLRERSSRPRSRTSRSRSRSRSRERDRRHRDYEGRDDYDRRRSSREYDDRSRRDYSRGLETNRHRSRDDSPSHRRHRDRSPEGSSGHRDLKRTRHESERRRDDSRDADDRRRPAEEIDRDVDRGTLERSSKEEEQEMDESILLKFGDDDEQDEAERILEESRKRREAIRKKHEAGSKTDRGSSHGEPKDAFRAEDGPLRFATSRDSIPSTTPDSSASLNKENQNTQNGFYAEASIAAATGRGVVGPAIITNGVVSQTGRQAPTEPLEDGAQGDLFADDMFGQSPSGERQTARMDGVVKDNAGLTDNWDDQEGYYTFRAGELLDGRYEVVSSHGKGVFSTVVKAIDLQATEHGRKEVAIKIIRSNETMFKAGQQELVILKKIAGGDPEDKRHCVRLLSSFQFRGHLCLVFESLEMNLREVLKKYGRNIGIKLSAVRAYATQLFLALKHLRNCGVLHCDIKPDNMLVNEAKNVLKLADFGSAMFTGDNEITPYLVSRFYRAPEIMLGLTYGHGLDMWSVGCCLYELYTGKMFFPGRNNNDMLRLHIELKGPFPKKLLRKAAFVDQHFDSDYNFCALEEDPVNPNKTVKRILSNVKSKDMGALLATPGSSSENSHEVAAFRDLLDKIFALDPEKRITASQALSHPFILGKVKSTKPQ